MDLGVRGKRYIVIGGSKGMGRAAAEALAADGANLVLVARGSKDLQTAAGELATTYGVDVATEVASSDDAQASHAVSRAIDTHGPVAGLAILAGPMDAPYGELHTLDDDAWNYFYEHQVMLTVRACRAVLPHLIEAGGGTIVTTAAYSIHAQKPSLVHYTAMKSAIASVTKNIAKTYGDRGIRANCVCPGMIDTPLLNVDHAALAREYDTDEQTALNSYALDVWGMKVALARVWQATEVGELVAFLLSDRAGYLTGATINIDGGTDF
jgi:NAD(P)-dependent dehydrogenase (short-subunit alcohol dehydrogenase family)